MRKNPTSRSTETPTLTSRPTPRPPARFTRAVTPRVATQKVTYDPVATRQAERAYQTQIAYQPDDGGDTAYYGSSGDRHTVARGETLFQLARAYYNDQGRWRDIYDANRDQLNSPHELRVGMDLVIP